MGSVEPGARPEVTMKVLQIGPFPPPYGGVERNLIAIRTFLRQRQIPCGVINITRHRKAEVDDVYQPKGALALVKLLFTLRYDIIHIHFGGMLNARLLSLYLLCTLVAGRRTVLTFHSGGYPSTPQGKAARPFSFAGFVFRRLDRLIAVNGEITDFFKRLGVKADRIRIIAPHAFVAGEGLSALPDELAAFAAAHQPLLVSVGGLEPEYDVPAQVELLGRLRTRWPNAGLAVIGSGSLASDLRQQVATRAYASHVRLCGDVPHASTMRAIAEADVLLRTTLYDGDAISVREALHLGTPVIATENGMRPAGVVVVPVADADALQQAAERTLSQGRAKRAAAMVPDESNLEEVLRLYQELTNRPSPGTSTAQLQRPMPQQGK